MDHVELWEKVKELLREEVSPVSFSTWIEQPLKPVYVQDDTLALEVISDYMENNVRARYFDMIESAVSQAVGRKMHIRLMSVKERVEWQAQQKQESLTQQESSSQQHGLGLRALLKPAIGFAASFALLFSLGYGIISLTKFLEKTPQKIALQMRDTTISSPIENNVANQTNEEATESIDAAEEYLIYYGATIATLTADATE